MLELRAGFDEVYTLADVYNMLYGYRYRRYLQSRENAQLALWIMAPHVKEIPSIDDLVGVWDNGEVVSVKEKYYRDKNRALKYKHTHNL